MSGAILALEALQAVRAELTPESQHLFFVREWIPRFTWHSWTVVVLLALMLLVLEASYRLSISGRELKYDPKAPKHFTDLTVNQLFALHQGAVTVKARADFARHVGKWIRVSGPAQDVARADDEWVTVHLNYAVTPEAQGRKFLAMPQFVNLAFYGDNASVAATLDKGDEVEAIGRIDSLDVMTGLNLVPSELITYKRASKSS